MRAENRVSEVLMLLIVLSLVTLTPLPPTAQASPDLTLVSYKITSAAGTTAVYPGSKGVTITVEIMNDEPYNISNVQGCFTFPEGFTTAQGRGSCSDATSPSGAFKTEFVPGEVFRITNAIDIDKGVLPGTYEFSINVSYTLRDPAGPYRKWQAFNLTITVSNYPAVHLYVREAWWGSDKVFPGTQGAVLYVKIENPGMIDVRGGEAKVLVPKPLNPSTVRVNLPAIPSGETVTIQVQGIDVPIDAKPGIYSFRMNFYVTAVTEDGVTYDAEESTTFTAYISAPEPLNVKVIDSGWVQGTSYGNARAVSVYVTLQNLDHATIETVVAKLKLPEGLVSRDGRDYVITTHEAPITFGDVFTLTFSNINVTSVVNESLRFELELSFTATYRGAEFHVDGVYSITANLISEDVLKIAQQRWVFNGANAEALPSAKAITLEITLVNYGQDAITAVIPHITLPEGIKLRSFGGSCETGVAPGATCSLLITTDIDPSVEPGMYQATLSIDYVVRAGNAYLYANKVFNLTFSIDDPTNYSPNLILSKAEWGTATPATMYGGERVAPANIEITNLGRYAANHLYVTITPLNSTVKVIEGSGLCSTSLPPGSACRTTFYLDLGKASEGKILLNVTARYVISQYGAFVPKNVSFITSLSIEEYAALYLGDVDIVSYGWANGLPVYPMTENATFIVTLANHNPYNIVSLKAWLEPPEGITVSGPVKQEYVPGPILTDQEAQLSFKLSVSDVAPGTYEASLKMFYVIESGGAAINRTAIKQVYIQIEGIEEGIEFVTTGWYGAPAQPNTYGNLLYVVFRNVQFPTLKGVVAQIELPQGFTSAVNNMSVVKLPATASLPQIPVQGGAGLTNQLTALLQNLQAPASLSKGDFIYVVTPINVLDVVPGTYTAKVTLSFIDQWGNLREYSKDVPISVLGSTLIVKVWSDDVLDFSESRDATLHIKLLNVGSAPIYNTYLTVYSPTSYILPKSIPIYVGELKPGEIKSVNVTVFLNPIPSQQVPFAITYGNMPFMAGIIYTDALGNRHTINATFTVSVQPFIDLRIQDVKVVKEGSTIKVSGTITNLGNAQAQRITAKLRIGDYESEEMFVGDLDPSSQTSFSVVATYNGSVEEVTIVLSYRNPYNEPEEITLRAPITEYIAVTTTPLPQEGGIDIYRVGTAAAVILFLVLVGLAIRKYLKQHPVPEEGIEGL